MKQVNLTTNESLRFFFDKETSPYVEGSFAKMGKVFFFTFYFFSWKI